MRNIPKYILFIGKGDDQAFNVIDTKLNKVVFKKISEHEAHKMVDLLNSCGIVHYKARKI